MPVIDPTAASPLVRAAQVASVLFSAAAAGGGLTISGFLIPRLLESPPGLMLRQWQRVYDTGKVTFPSAAAVAAVSFALVYAQADKAVATAWPALAAAGVCLSVVPYTAVALLPTNKLLFKRVAAAEADAQTASPSTTAKAGDGTAYSTSFTEKEAAECRALVRYWGQLNVGRGLLMTAGAVVGLLAYL